MRHSLALVASSQTKSREVHRHSQTVSSRTDLASGARYRVVNCCTYSQEDRCEAAVGAAHLFDKLRVLNTQDWKEGGAVELAVRLL